MAAVPFDPYLTKGRIFNIKDLLCIFQCGLQEMRRSLKANSLVVVSDHTKGFSKDRWEDNILYYTGMGLPEVSYQLLAALILNGKWLASAAPITKTLVVIVISLTFHLSARVDNCHLCKG